MKKFTIKIQDQEFEVPCNVWHKVSFYIMGVKDDSYISDDIQIKSEDKNASLGRKDL
jgi:hypothetical protein